MTFNSDFATKPLLYTGYSPNHPMWSVLVQMWLLSPAQGASERLTMQSCCAAKQHGQYGSLGSYRQQLQLHFSAGSSDARCPDGRGPAACSRHCSRTPAHHPQQHVPAPGQQCQQSLLGSCSSHTACQGWVEGQPAASSVVSGAAALSRRLWTNAGKAWTALQLAATPQCSLRY